MSSGEHALLEQGTTEELPGAGAVLGDLRVTRVLGADAPWIVYEADAPAGGTVRAMAVAPGPLRREERRRVETALEMRPGLTHRALPIVISTGVEGELKWIATEQVEGEELSAWLARTQVPLRRRIEIVLVLSDALQEAHLRGLVHGSVEADNVRVRPGGHPVLLDAGWLGMGDDRDSREDVHGLGVLLHQVVGGRHPDDGAALPRGDLRLIAGRCLAPDPADRYRSAGDVAEDLRRHLHHLPIRARRPGCLYSSRKALRRYFAPLLAVAGASVVLVVVAAMAVTEALRAEQARQSAAEARVRADLALRDLETVRSRAREASTRDLTVAEFLGSVLAPPDQGLDIDPALSEAVDAATARLEGGELASNPEAEAAARTWLADGLHALGRPDEARAQYEHVLELERQGWLPEADLSVARALRALADPREVGVEEGRAMLERSLDIVRTAHGEDHPDVARTWLAIGRFHRIAGAFDASERAIREAIDRLDARVGTPEAPRADARQQLAEVMRTKGRYEQAEVLHREALDLDLSAFGPDHQRVATDRLLLGSLLVDAGRPDEGLPLIDEALATRLAQHGEVHPRTVGARLNRVDALVALKWASAAQRELDLALAAERRRTGERPESAGWWVRRAEVALIRGKAREAHGYADRALLEREQELGLDHWRTAVARGLVGRALLARNRKRQSEPFLREARDMLVATVGPDSHHLAPIEEALAKLGLE